MKTKLIIALLVAFLFGVSAFAIYSEKGTSTENVRICPNSGLPCDGDGLCGSGNGAPCGCAGEKKEGCAGGCDGCANKTGETCPSKSSETKAP